MAWAPQARKPLVLGAGRLRNEEELILCRLENTPNLRGGALQPDNLEEKGAVGLTCISHSANGILPFHYFILKIFKYMEELKE